MTRKKKNTSKKYGEKSTPLSEPSETSQEKKWLKWIPHLLLFLIPFVLYYQSTSFGYVLDDIIVLSENNFVKQGIDGIDDIFTTESFTGFLGSQKDLVVGARYRPLSIATFALEYEFLELNPKVSHFINIILYALTGLLLFILLSALLKKRNIKWYVSIPFMASLLFILHPLHTEVVANIKSRDEILVVLFSLGALWFAYKYVQSGKKYALWLAPLIFLFAVFSKENALTFLAVVPVTLYYFTEASWKKIFKATLPLLAVALIFLFVRYEVIGYFLDNGKGGTTLMNNPFLGMDSGQKFATAFFTLGLYIKLLIFPHPLTHDYYPYQIPIMNWGDWEVILSVLIYVFLLLVAIRSFKKTGLVGWAILFYLLTLSIVSNLPFTIGTFMNERFMYLPSIGFVVVLSYYLVEKLPSLISKTPKIRTWSGLALAGLVIMGYSFKTWDRVPAWESNYTLNLAASTVSVNSARANQYMAYSLYLKANETQNREEKKKLLDEATYFVDRALKIHPTYKDANNAKAGIMAGYYGIDRDLKKLLDGFYIIQTRRLTPFVDTYLDYLDNRADSAQMSSFYKQLGAELIRRGYKVKGSYYLQKGS